MKFKLLEAQVRKQIKASMKRISEKLIKLNIEKTDRIDYVTAFNIWKSRFISISQGNKYYNLIEIDEELLTDFRLIMECIFLKEIYKAPEQEVSPELKPPKYYVEKPATNKQIFYAKYLMEMVKNEALPEKNYTMREISLLINDLKTQVKTG